MQTPELGQLVFGSPTGAHDLPNWVRSMFIGVMREFERVWWNTHQEEFEWHIDGDLGAVHARSYKYTEVEEEVPNFWIDSDDQRLCWYKNPGRSMSCTHAFTLDQWVAWHDAVFEELRRVDALPRQRQK